MSAALAIQTEQAAPLEDAPIARGPRVVTLDLDNAEELQTQLMHFRDRCLTPGVDFGVIPGTQSGKNTLYKPGAEKLCQFFGLSLSLEITSRLEDWAPNGIIAYEVKAILRSKKSGEIEAEGVGNCNSKERKYKNQDAANVANTLLKMAKKRAYIDATLSATRSSGLFEDEDARDVDGEPRAQRAQAQRPQQGQRPAQNPTPQRAQAPQQKPRLVATREQLARCERSRQRAVELGYRIQTSDGPKKPRPLADGVLQEEAADKCRKWEAFIKEQNELSEDLGEETAAQSIEAERDEAQAAAPQFVKREPGSAKFKLPKDARSKVCDCGATIYFATTQKGGSMPCDDNGDGYGSPHFITCPNAGQHRTRDAQRDQKPETKPAAPKKAAVDAEPGYANATPRPQIGMPAAQKRLWAVISAKGLPQAKEGKERDERIYNAGQVLLDHQFDVVESFFNLSDEAARCLITAIEIGSLTWGEAESEAA